MENILDYLDHPKPKKGKLFSIISFINGIITWCTTFYLGSQFPTEIIAGDPTFEINMTLIYLIWVFIISGVIFTILSFVRKEERSSWKIAGLILNGFITILLIGTIFFAFYVDNF